MSQLGTLTNHNLGGGTYASNAEHSWWQKEMEAGWVERGVTSEPTNPDGGRRRPGKSHATMRAPLRRTFE